MAAWTLPSSDAIAAALRGAGVSAGAPEILPRDDRFAALLPGDRIAWFPTSAEGLERLNRERAVLSLLAERCSFAVPRVIVSSPAGWDVRAMVAGRSEPVQVYERVKADPGFACRVGEGLGAILAEQHAAILGAAPQWLPRQVSWPPPVEFAAERLPRVTGDRVLIGRALDLLEGYEAEEARTASRVLVHTDFGFHNTVIDPRSGEVVGVFDYDAAAFADPCHDFRYLLLDDPDEALLEAALSVYEPRTGRRLDRARIRRLNAACAVAFLAFRAGAAPGERPAGRTLDEDLRWTRLALARADA